MGFQPQQVVQARGGMPRTGAVAAEEVETLPQGSSLYQALPCLSLSCTVTCTSKNAAAWPGLAVSYGLCTLPSEE